VVARPAVSKIVLLLFLGVIFFYSFNQLKESDSFYHLKTGQVIWETWQVPHNDIFSLSAYDNRWVTHEWLGELIFYGVYAALDFFGLISFVALAAALTYYLIYRLAIFRGANVYIAPPLLFLFGYLTLELWIPRPQIFAFFSLAILLYILEVYSRERNRKLLPLAVATIWFWANVNASFILGLLIFIFYFCAEGIKVLNPKFFGEPIDKESRIWLGVAATAAALVSLLNPNTYRIFTYSLEILPTVRALGVLEWYPITSFLYETEAKVFFVQILAAAVLLGWWLGKRSETRNFALLAVVVGVSILPFISIRHVGFWPIVAAAPLATAISGVFERYRNRFSGDNALLFIFILGIVFLSGRLTKLPNKYFNEETVPVYAADFIEKNHIQGPFFNTYDLGGYLIWRFWPEEKVFIDGRSEVFGPAAINEFFTITGGLAGWDELVNKKYNFNYFILSYRPEFIKEQLKPLMAAAKNNWPLVYWDDAAVVFVRNTPQNQSIIRTYGLYEISPFREPNSIPSDKRKEALLEIQKLLSRSPATLVIQNYAQELMASRSF